MMDYVQLLNEADGIVKSKHLYKRFIESTPLENYIAVWMADFAFERLESDLATAEQDSRQKQARIERLEQALKAMTKGYKSVSYAQWPPEMHNANEALEKSK